MGFTVDKFLFCLELQLAGIICAWWGMIISAISAVGIILGILFDRGNYQTFLPFHVNAGGAIVSAIISLILCLVYFYFSYKLLLGSQNGNSSDMFGYLIIHGIVVIIFIIYMFKNLASVLGVIIYCYLWFCVYSLYVRTGGTGIV